MNGKVGRLRELDLDFSYEKEYAEKNGCSFRIDGESCCLEEFEVEVVGDDGREEIINRVKKGEKL